MTWPDGIAAAILTAFALLITHHQHRSSTRTQHTRRTENGHDHTDPKNHRQEDRPEEDPGEEAGPRG